MKLKKLLLLSLCTTSLALSCVANASVIDTPIEIASDSDFVVEHLTDKDEIQQYCAENNMTYTSDLEELIVVTDISAIETLPETDDREASLLSHFFVDNLSHSYSYTSHDPDDILLSRSYPNGTISLNENFSTEAKLEGSFTAKQEDVIEASVGFSTSDTYSISVSWTSKYYDHPIRVEVCPKYTCYDGELWAAELGGGSSNDYLVGEFTAMKPTGYAVGVFAI